MSQYSSILKAFELSGSTRKFSGAIVRHIRLVFRPQLPNRGERERERSLEIIRAGAMNLRGHS